MDRTEEYIRNYINSKFEDNNCDYLDNWIAARNGNIVQVFIEWLEVENKKFYPSAEEQEFIEDYRCLSDAGKDYVCNFKDAIYFAETERRKLDKIIEKYDLKDLLNRHNEEN